MDPVPRRHSRSGGNAAHCCGACRRSSHCPSVWLGPGSRRRSLRERGNLALLRANRGAAAAGLRRMLVRCSLPNRKRRRLSTLKPFMLPDSLRIRCPPERTQHPAPPCSAPSRQWETCCAAPTRCLLSWRAWLAACASWRCSVTPADRMSWQCCRRCALQWPLHPCLPTCPAEGVDCATRSGFSREA